jgi:hypothetical protein
MNQRLIAITPVVTQNEGSMAQTAIPVRFDPQTLAFLTEEAARNGVSRSEYLRALVSRGLLAQSLEDAVSEIRSISGASGGGMTGKGFRVLLATLLETRNLLQSISAKNFPTAATEAKQRAAEEVDRLLGPEGEDGGA